MRHLAAGCVLIPLMVGCSDPTPKIDPAASAEGTPSAAPGAPAAYPERIIFTLTPFLAEAEMRPMYEPLTRYLGEALGIPTELRVARGYGTLARDLSAGRVHLAMLSPFAYVHAKEDHPELRIVAATIAQGSPSYQAYILSHRDSGFENLEDLRGRRFGFVDRQSASGYLFPVAHLRSKGFEPDELFGEVMFAGNHGDLLDLIANRKLDAGASYAIAFERPDARKFEILAKTGRIPLDNVTASGTLNPRLIERVKRILVGLSTRTAEGRQVLAPSYLNGFVAVDDEAYDIVRETTKWLRPQERRAAQAAR